MGRGRTRSVRLALALALATALAGVVAATAAATQFDDSTPCPVTVVNGEGLFVCPQGVIDGTYSIQLEGRGCPPFTYVVLNGELPPGISMSSSGAISGKPTRAGTWNFWLQLREEECEYLKTAEREFTITVNPRVIVRTQSALPATIGTAYNLPLEAAMMSGPDLFSQPSSPLTWTVSQGQLPAGLSLDSGTGVISGTPTTEGSSPFQVRAALPDGRSDTKGLEIVVRQPLAITAARPLAAAGAPTPWEVGVPFSAKLTATGGSGTYTWSVAGGALPTGFALAADGTLAGRTPTAGAYRATLRLTDSEGRTADYAAGFNVAERLAVATQKLRTGKVGRLYRAKVATSGGIAPRIWKIKRGPLPRGVRFDRTLGVLSGTPTRPGRYRVIFEATDALKVKALKTLVIDVLPSAP